MTAVNVEKPEIVYTPLKDISKIYASLKESYATGLTIPIETRLAQLGKLFEMLDKEQEVLLEAIQMDGKGRAESLITDILVVKAELVAFSKNLRSWLSPAGQSLDLINTLSLDSGEIVLEPLGTVLIIGTWNYPVNTSLTPLIGAIAAGNTCVLKLSEVSAYGSQKLAELMGKYLDPNIVRVVTGAVPEATELLKLKWDHIFYTGNGTVARVIAKAAAEHLTPVTLELGGKSPVFIHESSDIGFAARKIAFGKFTNCGQTCIAPDYVLIPSASIEPFVEALKITLTEFYGDLKTANEWKDYGRIASDRHWSRLDGYLKKTEGKIAIGGDRDGKSRFMMPTIVTGVTADDILMKEELFGPILPIVACETLDEAIAFSNGRDKPLSAYVFATDRKVIEKFKKQVTCGGLVINDTVLHYIVNQLPFGGVGESGMGSAHGIYSLKTFSHAKSVLWRSVYSETANKLLIYPPYSDKKAGYVAKLLVGTPSFQ